MMMKMTLFGLERWLNEEDSSLFADINLPVSDLLEKEELVNTILLECGEFAALYTDAEFMKFSTENFFNKNYRTFDKWIKALELEYDPLYNYDRNEEETNLAATDQHEKTDGLRRTSSVEGKRTTTSHTGEVETSSTNYNGEVTTETIRPDSQTSTSKFAGFGEANFTLEDGQSTTNKIGTGSTGTYSEKSTTSMSPEDKSQTTANVKQLEDDTIVTEGDAEKPSTMETGHVEGQHDTEVARYGERRRTLRTYGNIGVTTTQEMLESELNVAKFNLYNEIARRYMRELTIPVYL